MEARLLSKLQDAAAVALAGSAAPAAPAGAAPEQQPRAVLQAPPQAAAGSQPQQPGDNDGGEEAWPADGGLGLADEAPISAARLHLTAPAAGDDGDPGAASCWTPPPLPPPLFASQRQQPWRAPPPAAPWAWPAQPRAVAAPRRRISGSAAADLF